MLRRTKNISLVMLAAIAATACDETKSENPNPPNDEVKHCVDENGVVQDESKCAGAPEHHPMGPDGGPIQSHPSSGGGGGHFFWYYGGAHTTPGSRVGGGSYHPTPGKTYSPPSSRGGSSPSIGRGGFGSTGAGHGSTGGGS